ncbi:MAG TPA: site-specific integrase [Verrucomicrobiae bacterium]|nr:site-specific integrase [Verrucomicrobiae bacterium]
MAETHPKPSSADGTAINPALKEKWIGNFLRHLAADRGASDYTQRNYRHALAEFYRWHQEERRQPPNWQALQRDDFRAYLRFLGRGELGRAAIRLRFSALRSFFKFLVRQERSGQRPSKISRCQSWKNGCPSS